MMARGFKSVGWAAAVAGTALGCYMISLKVAFERAALEEVETRIVLAQRDIRILQTEIGTRGRLEQLEKWNVKVLALSAPTHNQFLEGSFQLASLTAPKKTIDPAAPVVLASAPAPAQAPVLADERPAPGGSTARDLMHVASMRQEVSSVPAKTAVPAKTTVPVTAKAEPALTAKPKKAASTSTPSTSTPSAKKTVEKAASARTSITASAGKAAKLTTESPVKTAAKTSPAPPSTKSKDTKSRQ